LPEEEEEEEEEESYIEYFDSLGFCSQNASYLLRNYGGYCAYNINRVMCIDDIYCSEFSIYFVINRIYNPDLSFHEFMNQYFSNNCEDNKRLVLDFMKEI
jgi:hypothetical protein